jgi:hypothetical protein
MWMWMGRIWWLDVVVVVGLGGDVPGVRDDDVVEGSVLLAEAGEAYPQYHCVMCGCGLLRAGWGEVGGWDGTFGLGRGFADGVVSTCGEVNFSTVFCGWS